MAQIHELLSAQQHVQSISQQAPASTTHASAAPLTVNGHPSGWTSSTRIESAAEVYALYCDCQPLPLLADLEKSSFAARDTGLQLAVGLLAGRFDRDGRHIVRPTQQQQQQLHLLRATVMQTIAEGPVELSTIQTLCLLCLIEFNDSSPARASTYSSLAMDLTFSAGLASEYSRSGLADFEERRRCYWSVVILKNLYGNMAGTFSFLPSDYTPKHPTSTQPPAGSSSNITEPGLPQPDDSLTGRATTQDLGILAYMTSMSELWAKTIRYAQRRGKSQQPPPWATESEYQRIMAQLMELETKMPYKYRFKPARFADYTTAELQSSRTFWSPWLVNQMLYHSLLCLLNHPLILSLQLRNFRMTMVPEVFLQHTDDLTQTHTNWVIHLIDQVKAKDFRLTDPYPAYCVAIVATIFLQQSYADDDEVRTSKQENFTKCLEFVRDLGAYWPRVAQLGNKVEQFQQVVSTSSQNAANAPDGKHYIDLRLFWEIIESCFTTELPAGPEPYFGTTLLAHRATRSADVVNGRLLPPPTRLDRGASAANTPSQRLINPGFEQLQHSLPVVDDQLSVLAQSYFAQGQDFVNLDDWWYPEQGV